MKLSFAALLSALAISPASAAMFSVTVNGVRRPECFMPIDRLDNTPSGFYDWYDAIAHNLVVNPNDNAEDLSIVVVEVDDGQDPSGAQASVMFIMDDPDDTTDITSTWERNEVTVSCEGSCGNVYPKKGFFVVQDDTNDFDDFSPAGDGPFPAGTVPKITFGWAQLHTDGAAVQKLSGPFTICIQSKTLHWPQADKMFVYNGITKTDMNAPLPQTENGVSKEICVTYGEECIEGRSGGSVAGDPHFELWNGMFYDFMGACDLVLLEASNFASNQDIQINVRTTIRYDYSYVENAAVKLGDDVFEVTSYGGYMLNGVSNAELPNTVGGYRVVHNAISEKVHVFEIQLAETEKIVIKTFKDMVAVNLDAVRPERLVGSKGMLGDYKTSQMLARNGTMVIENPNDFAAEWQVKEEDDMLFQTVREPQFPAKCQLPEVTMTHRRLGATVARDAAEKACAGWEAHFRASCVHDVMATGDLDLAAAGAF